MWRYSCVAFTVVVRAADKTDYGSQFAKREGRCCDLQGGSVADVNCIIRFVCGANNDYELRRVPVTSFQKPLIYCSNVSRFKLGGTHGKAT